MVLSSPTSDQSKLFRLHYGGQWCMDGPSYDWIGGDHIDISCTRRECRNLSDIEEIFRKNCHVEAGSYNYFYMIGGLRFDLNTDVEAKFLWSHMPTSSDRLHHVYCCKNRVLDNPNGEPFVDDKQDEIRVSEESVNHTNPPPFEASQDIDLGPQLSFSTYFDDLSPRKVSSLIVETQTLDDTIADEPFLNSEVDIVFETQPDSGAVADNQDVDYEDEGEINYDQIEDDIGGVPLEDESEYEEDSEDGEYEPESDTDEPDDVAGDEEELDLDEVDFLHNFREFSDKTFDCTETEVRKERRVTPNDVPLFVGQELSTMAECKQYLRLHAVKKKFEFRFQKNNADKIIVRCKNDTNCPWRCYVKRKNDGHTASCRTLELKHITKIIAEVCPLSMLVLG